MSEETWAHEDFVRGSLEVTDELGVCELVLLARLTPREIEVLRWQRAGCGATEIAGRLGIARETAKTHMKRVRAKIAAAREDLTP